MGAPSIRFGIDLCRRAADAPSRADHPTLRQ